MSLLHEILHFFGRAICHQLAERSIVVTGESLSVCARDTGIYIGIFSTLVYLHLTKRKAIITIPSIKVSFLLLFFLVPLMVDGLGSYLHLFESNNTRRLVTGISFGIVLPYFVYPLLSKKSLEQKSEPIITKSKDLFLPLIISCSLGGLYSLGQPSHLILDSFIIGNIIIWFTLCASFLFSFIHTVQLKWTLSFIVSFTFLSVLSLIHTWFLS